MSCTEERDLEMFEGQRIELAESWEVREQLGKGGFGLVYRASGSTEAAIKFVPKDPGSERELLFADLNGHVRNVVPVLDSGEHNDHWVLVMPLAQMSLRDYLDSGPLRVTDSILILVDVCSALCDLENDVVHRDLKPENVLLLNGSWCLADFGISRYAEATTSTQTRKFALTAPYAAPERWRAERATASTDVYSVGVMAFEMLSSALPFLGPEVSDFREQHLHDSPPDVPGVSVALASLVEECLYKAPGARPSAANLLARLERASVAPTLPGLSALADANHFTVKSSAEAARQQSEAQTEAAQRGELEASARKSLTSIVSEFTDAVSSTASAANVKTFPHAAGFRITLGPGILTLASPNFHALGTNWGGFEAPAFDVVCSSSVHIEFGAPRGQYAGRSHSLWFGDLEQENEFRWFELAFMTSPMMGGSSAINPFALPPNKQGAEAFWPGMAATQLGWPVMSVVAGELDEFIDRWATLLAKASSGGVPYPSSMPERPTAGGWRRK